MLAEGSIERVLDTMGAWRCVRFESGNVGVVNSQGRIKLVEGPVGRYCAMESYPGIWGVIAIDGKVEIEPKYEGVMIHTDGTVDLTVRRGKVITKKLP